MSTTKENFIKCYEDVKEDVIIALDKALERAIGNECIDFKKMEDNYKKDVYPLVGAVLQRELSYLWEGPLGVDDSVWRTMRRKATKYRNDFRIWMDYAGDYRNKD